MTIVAYLKVVFWQSPVQTVEITKISYENRRMGLAERVKCMGK
jgi:hypothetical protein